MKISKTNLLKKLIGATLLSFLIVNTAFAIGMSPPEKNILNLKEDSSAKSGFSISRQSPSKTEYYQVAITGSGGEAIHFEEDLITLPVGETSVEVTYYIQPEGFAQGSYDVSMFLTPSGGDGEGTMVIELGMYHLLNFTVVEDDIIDYSITNTGVQDVNQKLELNYRLDNQGNTNSKLSKVELIYTNDLVADSPSTTETFTTEVEKTPAFTVQDYKLTTENKLDPALYSITANFYDENGDLIFTKDTRLQIDTPPANNTLLFASFAIMCVTFLLIYHFRKK